MRKFFTLCAIVLFTFTKVVSQDIDIQKGDAHFEFFQYKEAINDYKAALKVYNPKVEMYLLDRLSQCYKFTFQYAKAEESYSKLIRLGDKSTTPDVYLDYAAILKINGDYTSSRSQYNYYLSLYPNDQFANFQLKSLSWAMRNKDSIRNFTVTPTNLNIGGQSLGYCFFDNGLIYSSFILKGNKNHQTQMFDLDYAEMKDSITFVDGEKFMDGISFELNEGSPSVSDDGMLVYFSANATKIKNGAVTKKVGGIEISSDGVANLKIYVAKFENGKFISPQELPFNNKEYNYTHPCITDNGNTLYFASDMPKGFGGMDIYKVQKKADGNWGAPENLGQTINTPENEIYPYVNGKALFFASKGLNGFGGYDLYQSKMNSLIPGTPINMGIPFNSSKDDVAFICKADGRTGYFSSNRASNEGEDKVYFYIDNRILAERKSVIIASTETKKTELVKIEKPVITASVETKKVDTPKVTVVKPTLPIAKVTKPILEKPETIIVSSKSAPSKPAAIQSKSTSVKEQTEPIAKVSDDELTKIKFEEVPFKFNDVSIPQSSYMMLDSAIRVSRLSKAVKIEIAAHTDSRGSTEYNKKLSERRAQSAKMYLIKKGVASSRIITHGFGETQLLNQCADGVECTEEQHQQNRRVDIKIVK